MIKQKVLTLLVLLITAATGAWADEVTFSVGELKNSLPSGNTSVEIPYEWTVSSQQPKVTIAMKDGTTGTLSVSQVLSLNANYTMTVSVPTGGSIDGITITTNPASQAGNISASTGTYSDRTWTPGEGDVTSVTFTPTGTFRLTQIVVVYTPAPAPAGYSVTMPQDTPDAEKWTARAGTDGTYQQLPLEGVAQGAQVSLKYEGALKVKSVKAKKAAPANVPVESITLNKTK